MAIPYSTKVNEQSAVPVINEIHTIGILGTATFAPGLIRLVQVPQGPAPAVTIPGYVEILSGTPVGVQYLVNYTTGVITFDSSLDGTVVLVSLYQGLGSEIAAEDVNELQNPVSAIIQQSIVYNWPAAPSVTWALAANSVTNASIQAAAGISLSKLQPLTPSRVPVLDAFGFLTASSVTSVTLSYLDATSSIQTQLNGKQATGNYIIALTGDVSATGPGSAAATVNSVGGSSAANVNSATIAANAATNLNTGSTIVKRDASGNFAAHSITYKNQGASIFEDTTGVPKTVTLEAPTTIATSYTLKWPTAQGTASTMLTNDGSGNLSWVAGGGSGSPGGSNGDLQYNNSGAFGGTVNITTDGSSITFTSPNFSEIKFFDNVHAFIGADPTGNTLQLLGPAQLDLLTANSGIHIVDNGFNAQITTNPSGVPDPSAILDLSVMSASQYLGFLPPLTTTPQRDTIGTPAFGIVTVVNFAALSGATYTVDATGISYPAQRAFLDYTVVNFAALSGAVVTINTTGVGGGTYTFTEGIDWIAATSNNVTAQNIVTAINSLGAWNAYIDGVYAVSNHLVIEAVTPGTAGNSIIGSTSDNINLPIEEGTSPQNFVGGVNAGVGGIYTLTEGVDWFATIDNNTTALSLANAINPLPVVNAAVGFNVITVSGLKVVGSDAITQATSDPVNLTISGASFTGEVDPTAGLMCYNKDNNQWEGWNGTTWVIIG